MFRDLLSDHRPLATHVSNARRAHGRLYRAVADREWLVAQAAILEALSELQRAYQYMEDLTSRQAGGLR